MDSATQPPPVGPAPPPPPASTMDDLISEMNKVPLFMTHLDPDDTEGNAELDALRSLAYEGTKVEVVANFREQGNEAAGLKRWVDAREFYDKAIAVLEGKEGTAVAPEAEISLGSEGAVNIVGVDERVTDLEEEERKERSLWEMCLVNRALCNLELKNYRSCNRDCAAALKLNPRNVKAYYRVALACLALDRLSDAADACKRALFLDPSNAAVKNLSEKVQSRKTVLEKQHRARIEREQKKRAEADELKKALDTRTIRIRMTQKAPIDMEDAKLQLEDPSNAQSTLLIPTVLLYPTHAQSDIIKAFRETDSLTDHLNYILPLPWDNSSEFTFESVECYMDTAAGGLARIGKKLALGRILEGGKMELTDGICRVYVVPKSKTSDWIAEVKRRKV